MLSEDERVALYDEICIPYSEEEYHMHHTNRKVKSQLEIEHAYNYEMVDLAEEWIHYIKDGGPKPSSLIWRLIRPGKDMSNTRCRRLLEIADYYKSCDYDKLPILPIAVYCSRSAATLFSRLEEIHSTQNLDDILLNLHELFSLISPKGKRPKQHGDFVKAVDRHVNAMINACEAYSHELGDYLRQYMRQRDRGDAVAMKSDLSGLADKVHGERLAAQQAITQKTNALDKKLEEVRLTTHRLDERDKRAKRKERQTFTDVELNDIHERWLADQKLPEVWQLAGKGEKVHYEHSFTHSKDFYLLKGVTSPEELKRALRMRSKRISYTKTKQLVSKRK